MQKTQCNWPKDCRPATSSPGRSSDVGVACSRPTVFRPVALRINGLTATLQAEPMLADIGPTN
eukprot:298920-Chlamydomonas_euryale.AAC.1